jgi:hypothetical protein
MPDMKLDEVIDLTNSDDESPPPETGVLKDVPSSTAGSSAHEKPPSTERQPLRGIGISERPVAHEAGSRNGEGVTQIQSSITERPSVFSDAHDASKTFADDRPLCTAAEKNAIASPGNTDDSAQFRNRQNVAEPISAHARQTTCTSATAQSRSTSANPIGHPSKNATKHGDLEGNKSLTRQPMYDQTMTDHSVGKSAERGMAPSHASRIGDSFQGCSNTAQAGTREHTNSGQQSASDSASKYARQDKTVDTSRRHVDTATMNTNPNPGRTFSFHGPASNSRHVGDEISERNQEISSPRRARNAAGSSSSAVMHESYGPSTNSSSSVRESSTPRWTENDAGSWRNSKEQWCRNTSSVAAMHESYTSSSHSSSLVRDGSLPRRARNDPGALSTLKEHWSRSTSSSAAIQDSYGSSSNSSLDSQNEHFDGNLSCFRHRHQAPHEDGVHKRNSSTHKPSKDHSDCSKSFFTSDRSHADGASACHGNSAAHDNDVDMWHGRKSLLTSDRSHADGANAGHGNRNSRDDDDDVDRSHSSAHKYTSSNKSHGHACHDDQDVAHDNNNRVFSMKNSAGFQVSRSDGGSKVGHVEKSSFMQYSASGVYSAENEQYSVHHCGRREVHSVESGQYSAKYNGKNGQYSAEKEVRGSGNGKYSPENEHYKNYSAKSNGNHGQYSAESDKYGGEKQLYSAEYGLRGDGMSRYEDDYNNNGYFETECNGMSFSNGQDYDDDDWNRGEPEGDLSFFHEGAHSDLGSSSSSSYHHGQNEHSNSNIDSSSSSSSFNHTQNKRSHTNIDSSSSSSFSHSQNNRLGNNHGLNNRSDINHDISSSSSYHHGLNKRSNNNIDSSSSSSFTQGQNNRFLNNHGINNRSSNSSYNHGSNNRSLNRHENTSSNSIHNGHNNNCSSHKNYSDGADNDDTQRNGLYGHEHWDNMYETHGGVRKSSRPKNRPDFYTICVPERKNLQAEEEGGSKKSKNKAKLSLDDDDDDDDDDDGEDENVGADKGTVAKKSKNKAKSSLDDDDDDGDQEDAGNKKRECSKNKKSKSKAKSSLDTYDAGEDEAIYTAKGAVAKKSKSKSKLSLDTYDAGEDDDELTCIAKCTVAKKTKSKANSSLDMNDGFVGYSSQSMDVHNERQIKVKKDKNKGKIACYSSSDNMDVSSERDAVGKTKRGRDQASGESDGGEAMCGKKRRNKTQNEYDGMGRVEMIDIVNLHKSFEERCTVCVLVCLCMYVFERMCID